MDNTQKQPFDNGGQLKIVEYNVIITIYAHNDEPLIHQVNRAIADGWQPLGGAAMNGEGENLSLTQTMVKYEKNNA